MLSLMNSRPRLWLVVAVIFSLVNLGGMVFAAARLEVVHTVVHAVLLLPALYLVWRLAPGRRTVNY